MVKNVVESTIWITIESDDSKPETFKKTMKFEDRIAIGDIIEIDKITAKVKNIDFPKEGNKRDIRLVKSYKSVEEGIYNEEREKLGKTWELVS